MQSRALNLSNANRLFDEIIATDHIGAQLVERSNGNLIRMGLGLNAEQQKQYLGQRWLELVTDETREGILDFLQSDEYGPYTYESLSIRLRYPKGSKVLVSMVKKNFGCLAVIVGESELIAAPVPMQIE